MKNTPQVRIGIDCPSLRCIAKTYFLLHPVKKYCTACQPYTHIEANAMRDLNRKLYATQCDRPS